MGGAALDEQARLLNVCETIVFNACVHFIPLISWISDTCLPGCTDLHSPVKRLDQRLLCQI